MNERGVKKGMFIRIGLVRNEKPKSKIVEEKKGWEVQCLAHNTTITTPITTPLITTCTSFFLRQQH